LISDFSAFARSTENACQYFISASRLRHSGEIWRTPRSWVEKAYPNVIYFNEVDKGGHFAAWEEPDLFSTEMRACFRELR
jgi:hypothetical protein